MRHELNWLASKQSRAASSEMGGVYVEDFYGLKRHCVTGTRVDRQCLWTAVGGPPPGIHCRRRRRELLPHHSRRRPCTSLPVCPAVPERPGCRRPPRAFRATRPRVRGHSRCRPVPLAGSRRPTALHAGSAHHVASPRSANGQARHLSASGVAWPVPGPGFLRRFLCNAEVVPRAEANSLVAFPNNQVRFSKCVVE